MLIDLNTNFTLNITYGFVIKAEIYELSLDYVDPVDPKVEVQKPYKINFELNLLTKWIQKKISNFFFRGHKFDNLLYGTPFCWLNIMQVYFIPNYGDYFIWGGFTPKYDPKLCPDGTDQPYGDWTAMLLNPSEIWQQVLENIKTNIQESIDSQTAQSEQADDDETDGLWPNYAGGREAEAPRQAAGEA